MKRREGDVAVRRFTVIPVASDVESECTEEVGLIGHMLLACLGRLKGQGEEQR